MTLPQRSRAQLLRAAACLGAAAASSALLAPAAHAASRPAGTSATGTTLTPSPDKHFFWAVGNGPAPAPPPQANNLIFHGGDVETKPAVYLVFWGQEWQHGFSVTDTTQNVTYTSAQAERYVKTFFANIGGSPWNGVQTQYCQNIALGSVSCQGVAGAEPVGNPLHLLHGTWVDPTPVPSDIVTLGLVENVQQDPLAAEAERAATHFGYDPNATYMIFTPPGYQATGYGSVYCAYHTAATSPDGSRPVNYAFIPFVPEQGAGCGAGVVNTKDNSFGNGYMDPYSIVAGHEFGEAETDPHAFPYQDGWNDAQTNEDGDKCAYTNMQNIALGGHQFAVQPMWSNQANGGQGGCAVALGQ